METSLGSLPRHMLGLVFSRLQPSALRSICDACRDFGQQPTGELITRLAISLPQLTSCRKRVAEGRFRSVTSVTIAAADYNPSPDRTTMDLVLFVMVETPAMTHLSRLELQNLPLTAVVAASACLRHACPHLSYIKLDGLLRDNQLQPYPLDLSHLWRALATVQSLRRLKITGCTCPWDFGLPGLGALVRLERLNVRRDAVQLADLAQLVALTKAELGQVVRRITHYPPSWALPPPARLALTRLRSLTLCWAWQDVAAFTACTALTSLTVDAPNLLGYQWDSLLEDMCLPLLVRLDTEQAILDPRQLLVMPALRQLRCSGIELPLAGTCLAFPHLRLLECAHFYRPWDNDAGTNLPAQPLAETFPGLQSLRWTWPDDGGDEGVAPDELWPATTAPWPDALAPLPAGHMGVLHSLMTSVERLTPALANSCGGVRRLVLVGIRGGSVQAAFERGLGNVFHHLQHLVLHSGADDGDLAALVDGWPRLHAVELSHLVGASDVGLVTLSRLRHLRRVVLVACMQVTAGGIAALARTWSVEVIEVWACLNVCAHSLGQVQRFLGRPQLVISHSPGVKRAEPWFDACL